MKISPQKWAEPALPIIILALLFIVVQLTSAQQAAPCNAFEPCKSGCCSSSGKCGFGDAFCGDGCQGTCNATAECGQYAPPGEFDCPLNVCCSKHGYCGFDGLFCNSECQNNDKSQCNPVSRPQCSEGTDAMSAEVRIAYYGAWSAERSCDAMQPENIPAGVLTHINVAFEYVSESHEITDEVGRIAGRVSRLKTIYPGLRVNIALGGWVFNDPPTQTRFSDMASTVQNRQKFILSLIKYMRKYALDGVDLGKHWEYPVADDRGGVPEDYKNFVLLCEEIKQTFDNFDPGWQLTLTLPASYWYLKNFDLKGLEKKVDWFNVMTYDIHGLWDQHNIWTGPFLKGHTNISEIEDGFDLLWRNGVRADKVVMGYGFYGRGFTMSDPSCSTPPTCTFNGPAFAGDCTDEPGILSYNEVISKQGELSAKVSYDKASSVKWMVYGSNQWISFDDAESFEAKKKYMFSRCLKGLMIWELGLDTANNDALVGLFGEDAVKAGRRDTALNPEERNKLAFELSAFTGQDCYVPEGCTNGKIEQGNSTCAAGFSVVELGHSLLQDRALASSCEDGWWHRVCCPTKALPKHCEWLGAPEGRETGCSGACGDSQFMLNRDYCIDKECTEACGFGFRMLCCDATDVLRKCKWTSCDWTEADNGHCKAGEVQVAKRFDMDNGDMCKIQTGMGNGGGGGTATHEHFRSFCCPEDDPLEDCKWGNDPEYFKGKWDGSEFGCPNKPDKPVDFCEKLGLCHATNCYAGSVEVTQALVTPHTRDLVKNSGDFASCQHDLIGFDTRVGLCCAPPSRLTKDWPVNPAWLWANAFSDKKDDVTWDWANNFGNNHADTVPNNLETDPGDDPYGFVMLDGPPGSIAKAFPKQFTIVTESEPLHIVPRSFVTTNQTQLDSTFEHSEEELLVYCNHPHNSHHCNEIFYKGAADTIIKLPHHVGEGPWARVVSMTQEHSPGKLPSWAIRKRQLAGYERNGLYRIKIDYNFHLIKREDGPVNMRVDYTNLQNYWDDVTDEPLISLPGGIGKHRRSDDPFQSTMNYDSWRTRVDRAKNASYSTNHDEFDVAARGRAKFEKRDVPPAAFDHTNSDHHLGRRWWGTFTAWLEKLTTITKEGVGSLPMGLSKVFNIYSGRLQCTNPSGVTLTAGLDITADVRLQMGTRYAYYFSGTVVPPKIIDTYVFLGAQPSIYAGVDIRGNAELSYESEIKKLISTITYPGLSIKGIATVGPSLDLLGQIYGKITVSGNLKVGAKYTLDPIEMYMPNDDKTREKASNKVDFSKDTGLQPVFQAGVRASVGLQLRITPRINCGIKVGGDIGPKKEPLVLAQVAVYMNTTLYFEAYVTAETNGRTNNWEYGFKVELWWRIVFDADAQLYLYGSWKSDEFVVVDWQTVPIYNFIAKSSPENGLRHRAIDSGSSWELSENPLANPIFGKVYISNTAYKQPTLDPFGTLSGNSSSGLFTTLLNSTLRRSNMQRRAEPGEENEFMLGEFKCTTGPSACESNSISIGAVDPFARRSLAKRAATDCALRLPNLYYNCAGPFADQSIRGPSGVANIQGICGSIRNYLNNHGITTNRFPLTFDPNNQGPRRRDTCAESRNPCGGRNGQNERYKRSLGGNWLKVDKLVTCDEFPFASTEEGGKGYIDVHPTNPLGSTRTCAPRWQQDLQGNCNALLGLIEQNVEYFNTPGSPTNDNPAWYPWAPARSGGLEWNKLGRMTKGGDPGRQRMTRYPQNMPFKINSPYQGDRSLSYMHRRNFTLHLVNNGLNGPVDFHGSTYSQVANNLGGGTHDPEVPTVTNAGWIICAVSLRGQQRYRFIPDRNYNGWCWDGQTMTPAWEAPVPNANPTFFVRVQYFQCRISFTGEPFVKTANEKRSEPEPIGFFGEEPVYKVERVDRGEIISMDLPHAPLPDSRQAFPLS